MDNTPFSKKVEILAEYYSIVCEDDVLSDFVLDNRDTLFICLASSVKWVSIEPRFHWAVDKAWESFCEFTQIDKYGEYESLDQVMDIINA